MQQTRPISQDLPQTARPGWVRTRPLLVAGLLTLALAAPMGLAQSYSIDWWTIDGGGGTSSGGTFSLSGSIGQPDAGTTMTGGQFSVTGGFWALPVAVPATGAPTLTIVPAGPGQAAISWAPNTPGFVLQISPTLHPLVWANAPSVATNPVVVPASLPTTFYRLIKP
jgi:hypothetical protein